MGFITPALLAGAALVAVPIALHLIMRREVRQLVFPALRFVQQRRSVNQHRLRLRHLLLLLLRCAIIALLAFALARPTLRRAGAVGKEGDPVAAALVFDNSLRMDYVHENQSHFDRSRQLAAWLLAQLPAETPVAVIDRETHYGGRGSDRSAAELRVERLSTSGIARPLSDALVDAVDWLRMQPDYRGEIYIFTDLAAVDWTHEALAAFKARLDELPVARAYVIDVGKEARRNFSLGELRLSAEELTPGGMLQIETDLVVAGDSSAQDDLTVELYTQNAAGATEKRGQQVVTPTADATPIEFSISGLDLGTHQGFVQIVGGDPLASDDIRYFTVQVRPPRKVLLLGKSADDTLFLREALAPSSAAGLLRSKFVCESRRFSQLDDTLLANFDAVGVVDPPPLPTAAWQAFADYAHAGGGIAIFLGRNAQRDPFNEPAPQQLLPAKLRWQSRDATYLRPSPTEHPALAELADLGDAVPWSEFPVFRYWELESLATDAFVLAPYANGQPAIVERPLGDGHAIAMTTSVSDPAHRDPWNLLPTGPDPWPFLALANGLFEYLAGGGDTRLNYFAGQTALLPLSPDEQVTNYVLTTPGESPVRQPFAPGQAQIVVTSTETLGNYRVRAGGEQGRLDRGFSVNAPADISRLERVDFAVIAETLGKERVLFARSASEIEVRVGQGRVGHELFPYLILATVLVLAAESLLANRFYRDTA